jgi:hypothetical protein
LTPEVQELRSPSPLAAPGFDRLAPAEAARWRRRLEKSADPCGCKSGAAVSLAALVAWPVWILTSGMPHGSLGWGVATLSYIPVVVVAGIVGKVAGIIAGRWRLRYLRRKLARVSRPLAVTEA